MRRTASGISPLVRGNSLLADLRFGHAPRRSPSPFAPPSARFESTRRPGRSPIERDERGIGIDERAQLHGPDASRIQADEHAPSRRAPFAAAKNAIRVPNSGPGPVVGSINPILR